MKVCVIKYLNLAEVSFRCQTYFLAISLVTREEFTKQRSRRNPLPKNQLHVAKKG